MQTQVIKVTTAAAKALQGVASDPQQAFTDMAEAIEKKCLPKYAIDTADNITFCGIALSWIRDNEKGEILFLTREEGAAADKLTLANIN